jgi:tetratricopeptide (TPR) repeat protein
MKNLIFFLIITAVLYSQITWSQGSVKSDTIQAQLNKARELAMQGKKAEASETCLKIMQSLPDNKTAVQYWLMVNMKRTPTGEMDAIVQLDSLGNIYPNNTGILFFKIFILAEYGKNEEALAGFDKLIALQPDTAVNWIGKGQVLSALNKHKEALSAFEKANFLDPKRFDVYNMKAMELAKLERFDEAIATLGKGIEINPKFPVNFYNRACIYSLKGDKVNALTDLKQAISMNPGFKQSAVKDEDFKTLYEDEDFKALTK